jgi:hypothetical protein
MDLERVLIEACDALATRKFTRGTKKSKLGSGLKQALPRAVLQAFGREMSADGHIRPLAPRLRLTARAMHDCRNQLGFPELAPAAASDALYEWSLLLKQPQTVDVEDGKGVARVTLRMLHARDTESFDLTVDVRADAAGDHTYESILQSGTDLSDVRTLLPGAQSADAEAPEPSKLSRDRERREAKLLLHAASEQRLELREKLRSASDVEFDRFERDFYQVHRIRPKWAVWILAGIVGTPLGAYFGYRYYASISVPSPSRFLLSENIQVLPDGTFVIADAGIETKAIENPATGERLTVTPMGDAGGLRFTYKNSQHMVDGIGTAKLASKLGRWVNGNAPGVVILPLRELADVLRANPRQPIPPTVFMAYILPKQDEALAGEIANHTAKCTILFSEAPAAGATLAPSPFDVGTQADRIWGWVAGHEYSSKPGRYDIQVRITRANGHVEHYDRVLFVDGGRPHPWSGEKQGELTVLFNQEEQRIPLYAGISWDDCCYVGEPVFLKAAGYGRLISGPTSKGGIARHVWIVWESSGWSEEIPIQRNPDGTVGLLVPPHAFDSPGRKEIHLIAEFGPNNAYTTILPVDVKPARLH